MYEKGKNYFGKSSYTRLELQTTSFERMFG